jgi:putative membrane protein
MSELNEQPSPAPGVPNDIAAPSVATRPTVGPLRQHPGYLLIAAGQTLRALIPVVVISVFQAPGWIWPVLAAVLAVGAIVLWRTNTYSVAEGEFRLRSGVLRRTLTAIPLARITAVDAQRGVVQRLLGMWGLRIQTPGDGSQATATLHGLSQHRLDELLDALRPGRAGQPPAAASDQTATNTDRPPAGGTVIAVLDGKSLFIAAVTGSSLPLILAGVGVVWDRAREVIPDSVKNAFRSIVAAGLGPLLLVIAGLLLLATVIGIILTALRLARFSLVRDGDRLRMSRGLLSQRSSSVQVQRVQAVRLVEGILRRPLGYCALEVEVAGVGQGDSPGRMLFPLVRRSDAERLLTQALPELGWRDEPPTHLPRSVRRRYFTLPLLAAAAPAIAAAVLLPGWWALTALLPLALAVHIGRVQGATAGWRLDDSTAVLRWHRVLARHTVVARVTRVQITRLTRTVFQRRAGLAGIRLQLSSMRSARLRHLADADADHLLHVVGRRRAVDAFRLR